MPCRWSEVCCWIVSTSEYQNEYTQWVLIHAHRPALIYPTHSQWALNSPCNPTAPFCVNALEARTYSAVEISQSVCERSRLNQHMIAIMIFLIGNLWSNANVFEPVATKILSSASHFTFVQKNCQHLMICFCANDRSYETNSGFEEEKKNRKGIQTKTPTTLTKQPGPHELVVHSRWNAKRCLGSENSCCASRGSHTCAENLIRNERYSVINFELVYVSDESVQVRVAGAAVLGVGGGRSGGVHRLRPQRAPPWVHTSARIKNTEFESGDILAWRFLCTQDGDGETNSPLRALSESQIGLHELSRALGQHVKIHSKFW